MDERQLIGVLAHELSHVKNRDTLIGTIAATIGGTISFLAQMGQFQLIFGGGDDDNGNPDPRPARRDPRSAAMVIQRRGRRGRVPGGLDGRDSRGDPEGLAQALETLQAAQQQGLLARMRGVSPSAAAGPQRNPAFSHLWIVNPLSGKGSPGCSRPIRRSTSGIAASGRWLRRAA